MPCGTRASSASTTAAPTAASCPASSTRTPATSSGWTIWSRPKSAERRLVDDDRVVLTLPPGDVVGRPHKLRAGRHLVGRNLGHPDTQRRVAGISLGE